MAGVLDSHMIETVFESRPDIIAGVKKAADTPGRVALFNEIASHVYDRLRGNGEPAQKKRKTQSSSEPVMAGDEPVLLEVGEISVSVPQRKKLDLCFTANHFYAKAPGTTTPIPNTVYAWRDFEYAFYLPVPEKAQVQHNYVLFPKNTYLPSKTATTTAEPLVFTVPATAPKQGTIGGSEASAAAAVSDTYKSLFHWALAKHLKAAGNGSVKIVSAEAGKFQSQVRQAHRPNERAVHVSGFRGSKDGYLFFLDNGILWGFKKPLIFVPISHIAAISYTSVLQITFNMVVEVMTAEGVEEVEFGMLDQRDYGGIDAYVRSNRLQDRSMAEQRKAKLQLAENKAGKKSDESNDDEGEEVKKKKKEEEEEEEEEEDGLTELERAEREAEQRLQDEEDENEEDYDPGSEGESEGSGSSSEAEEAEDDEQAEDDEDEDEDAEEEVKEEVKETSMPVRSWTTLDPPSEMDMDEKFDVVG